MGGQIDSSSSSGSLKWRYPNETARFCGDKGLNEIPRLQLDCTLQQTANLEASPILGH
jgi:hypothetical protein